MIRSEEHLYYSGRDFALNYGIRGYMTQGSKKMIVVDRLFEIY
jgi:hypothetical protein